MQQKFFDDGERLNIQNFECESSQAGNNGGETCLEIKNSDKFEFTDDVSNNAQAGVDGAIVCGYDLDSTTKKLGNWYNDNILGVIALKYVGIVKRMSKKSND